MFQESFPLDILLEILDLLAANEDLVSVKACSLTCKGLRPICQKHLFSKIDLIPQQSAEKGEYSLVPSFAEHIFTNLNLAPYVKTLNICFQRSDYQGTVLAEVLRCLHGITSFSLSSLTERLLWDELDDSLRESLEHVITSPKLLRLNLKYCERLPIVLLRMPINLTHLSLGSIPTCRGLDTDIREGVGQYPTQLRSFSFGSTGSRTALRLLHERWKDSPFIDFLSLSELCVGIELDNRSGQLESPGFHFAEELVPRLQALRSLSYTVWGPMTFSRLLQFIRRSSFKTLRTLAFIEEVSDADADDTWLGLCDELPVIPKENVIEEMSFIMRVIPDYNSTVNLEAWKALGRKLGRSNFPRLAKITFEIYIDRYDSNKVTLQESLQKVEDEAFACIRQEYGRGYKFSVVITDI